VEVDQTEIDALAGGVVEQIELVEGEVPCGTRVGNGTHRNGGHHELHGLLQVDGLVKGTEGAEHQPRGANPATGHENPVGGQAFQLARFRAADQHVRIAVDLVEVDGKHVGPVGDPLVGSETVERVGARV